MANKTTKRDNFNAIIEVLKDAGKDNLVAVMEHEIELLNKKHSGVSKADEAKRADNKVLQERIVELLAGKEMTASEIAKALSTDEVEYSNQKVSAMIRQIGDSITKNVVKGKAYFTVA